MPMKPPIHRPPGWSPPTKRADTFYSSAAWRRFRRDVLERDGGRCTWIEDGVRCSRPAAVVDHPLARRDGGADFDRECRSLCRLHDNRRHAEKGGRHD
jgi:hypothetical protein